MAALGPLTLAIEVRKLIMAESPESISKHRRNLMVLSTLFFLYVATGTSVMDIRNVRVYFISAEVSRPEVIIYFSWILLGWYFYRFWLSQRGYRAFHSIKNRHMNEQLFLKNYFLKIIKEQNPNRRELKVEETSPKRKNKRYYLETNRVSEINEEKNTWSEAEGISKQLDIGVIEWHYLLVRHIFSVALTKSPLFWDSIFPYYFALVAIFVGLYRGFC